MSSEARRALVSGSSSGIGLAISRALLADGWSVTGLDRAPAQIEDRRFRSVELDLCDAAATEAALRAQGPVQALVHAAGVLRVGRLGELDGAAGEQMWRLHVDAATRLADQVVPPMVSAGGGRWSAAAARASGWPSAVRCWPTAGR